MRDAVRCHAELGALREDRGTGHQGRGRRKRIGCLLNYNRPGYDTRCRRKRLLHLRLIDLLLETLQILFRFLALRRLVVAEQISD